MTDDAWQGMLFGATSAEGETTEDGPVDELRVCALNVNSPNPSRAQRIVNWLLATKSNTLVLTELQPSEGGRHMLAALQAEGFTATCTPGWKDARYFAAVATRGVEAVPVQPAGFDPRVAAVDLTNDATTVRLVGLYGPTNGMTAESSHRRREFQRRFLDYLAEVNNSTLCVVGDLNVVEPNHRPHLPAFEDHDYAFYAGLLTLGLRDAYRELNRTGGDHSWINPASAANASTTAWAAMAQGTSELARTTTPPEVTTSAIMPPCSPSGCEPTVRRRTAIAPGKQRPFRVTC